MVGAIACSMVGVIGCLMTANAGSKKVKKRNTKNGAIGVVNDLTSATNRCDLVARTIDLLRHVAFRGVGERNKHPLRGGGEALARV